MRHIIFGNCGCLCRFSSIGVKPLEHSHALLVVSFLIFVRGNDLTHFRQRFGKCSAVSFRRLIVKLVLRTANRDMIRSCAIYNLIIPQIIEPRKLVCSLSVKAELLIHIVDIPLKHFPALAFEV